VLDILPRVSLSLSLSRSFFARICVPREFRAFPERRRDKTKARSMIGWNSERNVLRKRNHGPRTVVLPRSASFPAGGTSDFQNKQKGARMWLKVLKQNITHLARRAKGERKRETRFCHSRVVRRGSLSRNEFRKIARGVSIASNRSSWESNSSKTRLKKKFPFSIFVDTFCAQSSVRREKVRMKK